jgi:transcriptional regulator with XRE-family HTH domain
MEASTNTMTTVEATRRAKQLTQVELARRAGVDERTIRNVESGAVVTHPRTRHLIANALGVQIPELWPDATPEETIPSRRHALGLSQVELAVFAGISPSPLRRLEHGDPTVSGRVAEAVLEALDTLERDALEARQVG